MLLDRAVRPRCALILTTLAVVTLLAFPAFGQSELSPAGRNDLCPPDGICGADQIGVGYHPFGHTYALLGFNAMLPCGASTYELESSVAHVLGGQANPVSMLWFGAWGTLGFRAHRNSPCSKFETDDGRKGDIQADEKFRGAKGRVGGGVELGWRMIGVDFGYIRDEAVRSLHDQTGNGWRFRSGLALSHELFTGGDARYRRSCCRPSSAAAVPCECERTAVGISLFLYYAHEHFYRGSWTTSWYDNMVGLSAKIGFQLW